MKTIDDSMKNAHDVSNEEVTIEEVVNSKRWQKSATPKYTLDWYVKWIASILLLCGMSMRGIDGFILYDLTISITGVILWLWVSILWKDRALIVVNSVGLLLLIRNLLGVLINV